MARAGPRRDAVGLLQRSHEAGAEEDDVDQARRQLPIPGLPEDRGDDDRPSPSGPRLGDPTDTELDTEILSYGSASASHLGSEGGGMIREEHDRPWACGGRHASGVLPGHGEAMVVERPADRPQLGRSASARAGPGRGGGVLPALLHAADQARAVECGALSWESGRPRRPRWWVA